MYSHNIHPYCSFYFAALRTNDSKTHKEAIDIEPHGSLYFQKAYKEALKKESVEG